MIISFDVEASGPSPLTADIISVGFVVVDGHFKTSFYGEARPELLTYKEGAYKSCNITREQHEGFAWSQKELALAICAWVETLPPGHHTLISDNPAFDWQWINGILHKYCDDSPFGFSARRIGDFAAGLSKDWRNATRWKRLRRTKHTHNPVDDARGNAEALWTLLGRDRC